MQLLVDLPLGIWIVFVLWVMLCAASAFRAGASSGGGNVARLGAIGRTLAIFWIGIPLLAAAHLFNWFTALAICALAPLAALWRARRTDSHARGIRWAICATQQDWIRGVRAVIFGWRLKVTSGHSRANWLLVLTVAARPTMQALVNLRLPSPADYTVLRMSHELLTGGWSGMLPAPSSALVAIVARLAASDPMEVVRFLHPILYVSCALTAAWLVTRLTVQRELGWLAGLIAALGLETPFFHLGATNGALVPAVSDLLAVSALLAGFTLLFDARRRQTTAWEACATLVVAGASLPSVGLLALLGAAVVTTMPLRYVGPSLGVVMLITGFVVGRTAEGMLPAFGPFFVLVGAGLIVGFVARSAVFRFTRQARRLTAYTHPLVVVPGIFLLATPMVMPALYLEHEAAARQTLALAHLNGNDRWALIGAPEQLIEIGETGHFADLQHFVSRYGSVVSNPRFRFDIPVERLFIQVEKHPFQVHDMQRIWSPSHAADVEWAAYRLPERRAELNRNALELCEAYRRTHAGVSIAYEDDDLRVYAIHR
jgi:hypothetical protein